MKQYNFRGDALGVRCFKDRNVYTCGWTQSSWSEYIVWKNKYFNWYPTTTWTYTSNTTLNACQYTCNTANGYVWSGNNCIKCPAGTYNNWGVCVQCAAWYYGASIWGTCSQCAAWTHSSTGATSCTSCAAWRWSTSWASSCSNCTAISNSNWTTSWTAANNCGFACDAWYKYNRTARTCTACANGTYTTTGNTSTSCWNCTWLPSNAQWSSNGYSSTSCRWICKSNYTQIWNSCKSCNYLSSVPTNATLYLPSISNGSSISTCTVNYNKCFIIMPTTYNCTYTSFPSSISSSCTSLNLDALTSIDSTQWNKIKNSNVTTLSIAWMSSIDSIGWNAIQNSKITTLNIPWITSMDSIAWAAVKNSKLTSLNAPWITSTNSIVWNDVSNSKLTTLSLPWITSMDTIAWNEVKNSKLYALQVWLTSAPSGTYVNGRCTSHAWSSGGGSNGGKKLYLPEITSKPYSMNYWDGTLYLKSDNSNPITLFVPTISATSSCTKNNCAYSSLPTSCTSAVLKWCNWYSWASTLKDRTKLKQLYVEWTNMWYSWASSMQYRPWEVLVLSWVSWYSWASSMQYRPWTTLVLYWTNMWYSWASSMRYRPWTTLVLKGGISWESRASSMQYR